MTNKAVKDKVPNLRTFVKVLRVIKMWAKLKGIHYHIFNFFSGISLAIMVAKICHIYKSLSVLEQVCKFFEHFSQNLSREIRIHKVSTNSQSKGTPKKLDGEVQVLNPTFPHSNTCNISKSALFVIKKEISNARI